jgi:hypothetical protein
MGLYSGRGLYRITLRSARSVTDICRSGRGCNGQVLGHLHQPRSLWLQLRLAAVLPIHCLMKSYLPYLDCLARLVVYLALTFPLTLAHAASNSRAGAAEPELNQDPATPVEKKARNITEQAIASRLQLTLNSAEIIWLEAQDQEFLAVYRDAEIQPPSGAIIINTANGLVVESSLTHRTIAEVAARSGWASLSIQANERSNEVSTSAPEEKEAAAYLRLNSALDYVRRQAIENIVIVGDAGGANVAIQYITKDSPAGVVAVIGLGLWHEDLTGIDIPLLDIVGTRDHQALIKHQARAAKTRQRDHRVDLIVIDGADASFTGYEDVVAKRLRGWLERVTPGVAVRRSHRRAAAGASREDRRAAD